MTEYYKKYEIERPITGLKNDTRPYNTPYGYVPNFIVHWASKWPSIIANGNVNIAFILGKLNIYYAKMDSLYTSLIAESILFIKDVQIWLNCKVHYACVYLYLFNFTMLGIIHAI